MNAVLLAVAVAVAWVQGPELPRPRPPLAWDEVPLLAELFLVLPADVCPYCHCQVVPDRDSAFECFACPRCGTLHAQEFWDAFNLAYDLASGWHQFPFMILAPEE